MKKATPQQRIILRVLAHGGWLIEGTPGERSPRLWAVDGRLWSLVPRQSFQALVRRGWVALEPAWSRGIPTYSATPAGRAVIGERRP